MNRLIILKLNLLLCLLFFFISCYVAKADDGNKKEFISLNISATNLFYNELREYYEKIELGYIRGNEYKVNYGKDFFVLEKLEYYGIRGEVRYFLGYMTSNGIYDKYSKLLKSIETPGDIINMGLSSRTLEAPWEPSFALQDLNWKNEIFNSDRFAYLRIDFINNSLALYEPEY